MGGPDASSVPFRLSSATVAFGACSLSKVCAGSWPCRRAPASAGPLDGRFVFVVVWMARRRSCCVSGHERAMSGRSLSRFYHLWYLQQVSPTERVSERATSACVAHTSMISGNAVHGQVNTATSSDIPRESIVFNGQPCSKYLDGGSPLGDAFALMTPWRNNVGVANCNKQRRVGC